MPLNLRIPKMNSLVVGGGFLILTLLYPPSISCLKTEHFRCYQGRLARRRSCAFPVFHFSRRILSRDAFPSRPVGLTISSLFARTLFSPRCSHLPFPSLAPDRASGKSTIRSILLSSIFKHCANLQNISLLLS